jgi:hypothetical protein
LINISPNLGSASPGDKVVAFGAPFNEPLPAPRQTKFDDRTKAEHGATILLPNPVAAHNTERDVTDNLAKILKENRVVENGPSPAVG